MMKKIPIGISTLKDMIQEDYLYIDKTDIALSLIQNGRYYFLSRPRRFGKSLFLNTLKEIFQANQTIFQGLYIYDRWNWSRSYPVISIDFAKSSIESRSNLDDRILKILKENQDNLGIECEYTDDSAGCFRELIIKTAKKYQQKVVVLVDEYDKPILDNIEKPQIASEVRDGLYNFYSVIKGSDEFLEFVFITGVSKFARASIFSGLNMLEDISLSPKFGTICGYTQNDIETTILPYLKGVDLAKLKAWYNGYNFLGDRVYNPFDILSFIKNDFRYESYWFRSGTPSFLMKLIQKQHYFLPNLNNITVGKELLESFDIDKMKLEIVLFQTGYLTIAQEHITPFETIEFTLKTPNKEVQLSFNNHIITYLTDHANPNREKTAIYESLYRANLEGLKSAFAAMFASISYHNYTNNTIAHYEGFYASIIYVYLASLGITIEVEPTTNKGRVDMSVLLNNNLYIIEFKVGEEDALAQIKSKQYYQKYLNQQKTIYLVGINFDEKERNISNFQWEELDQFEVGRSQ